MPGIAQVRSPAAWRGEDIGRIEATGVNGVMSGGDPGGSAEWAVSLGEAQRAEVLDAVRAVQTSGEGVRELSREDFPLPTLGPELALLAAELADRHGFGLLRGVPVEGLDEAQCDIVAVGLGRHVGRIVPQGADGTPLIHVRDAGAEPGTPTTRSYQHRRRLGYHRDPTDFVALLCVQPAKSGGLSSIVSAVAVHNEIVRTRPDLAEVLYEPWWFDRRTGDGPDSFYAQPVYTLREDGRISAFYGPDYMRSALRGAHVPPFSQAQSAAMDLLDRLTDDPRFAFTMDLRAGDMQFLNNHVVMHSRTEYEDHPEPDRRRDLIRLWLAEDR